MEPKFHDPLDTRAYRSNRFKLLIPFRYTTLILNGGTPTSIEAPKGFITDFASIPRAFRSLIPVNGRHRGAAVIHDYLYATSSGHRYSRLECDRVFLEAMNVAKVNWFKRSIMFSGVRAGGWLVWNKYRNLGK